MKSHKIDDRKRITCWLRGDISWLDSQRKRIDQNSEGKQKCVIVNRDDGHQALFYTNGYFENGSWCSL